jgi:Fur family transcriptional regulator, ferric uptake regulator
MSTAHLLQEAGLRQTSARLFVLDKFSNCEWALSHKDLEDHALKELDRVTIYRTLHTFESKGLLHKVLDSGGVAHYALCKSKCDSHQHIDNHMHFHCNLCGRIYCLTDFDPKLLMVPQGFKIETSQIKLDGMCKFCN